MSMPSSPGDEVIGGERSRAHVETLHATASVIVREPDRRELARSLALQLARDLHAGLALVAVIDDDTMAFCARSTGGEGHDATVDEETRAVLEWVAQRRQGWQASHPDAMVPPVGLTLSALGWRSVVAVPALHHQGHANAVLLLADRAGAGPFPGHVGRLLEVVAAQAAVGFDRGLLLDQLGDWTRGMQALLAFSSSVHRTRDAVALLDEVVQHASDFLHADGGRAGLRTEEGMSASRVWSQQTWRSAPRSWRINEGVPGTLLSTEFPLLSPDYARDPLADGELRDTGEVGSALAVPLKASSGEVLGFLELFRRPGREPLTWQDIAFAESLAGTAAVAIENGRLARTLAQQSQELRALSADHVQRLEAERQHIARELHDEAGQALVGIKLSLQALGAIVGEASPDVQEALAGLQYQAAEATTRLRELARRLRPPTLDRLGLQAALRQLVAERDMRGGCRISLELAAIPERLPPATETALFRVGQEALTNAARHSNATQVMVALGACEGRLWMRIADNGVGFDPQASSPGLGLLGIRERLEILDGAMHIRSAPDQGTELVVEVPLTDG